MRIMMPDAVQSMIVIFADHPKDATHQFIGDLI